MKDPPPEEESRGMKITISIGVGRHPDPYRLAEFLERQGSLERIISPMPRFRLEPLALDNQHLVTIPWLAYLNYGLSKLPYFKGVTPRQYWLAELMDKAARERLGACDIFDGWCSTSLWSMRRARERGALTVLQTGSAHIAYQAELLEMEYAKFGVRCTPTDPRVIEKGTQEFIEADHIVAPSAFVLRTLLAKGIERSKVSIVPAALRRPFRTQPKQDEVFRIIAVGIIGFRKGIQYLLEAVSYLRLPNTELLLVGGVEEEFVPVLGKYEGQYTLAGRVYNEKLDWCYSQASVFVLPSVEDGWGHVTMEAMSCGLPVIVSANAGSADVVQEGISGFVVPACDTQALKEKIELLYRNPELRQEMGRQAQTQALVTQRTWEEYGRQMQTIFVSLLAGRFPLQ